MQPEQEPNPNLSLSDSYNTSGQWSAAFSYNALGDLVRATDANGVSIINEYDKAKRVTKRCYSKPNVDPNSLPTTCAGLASNDISDNTPEVTFLYDGLFEPSQTPAPLNYAKGKLTRVCQQGQFRRASETRGPFAARRVARVTHALDAIRSVTTFRSASRGAIASSRAPHAGRSKFSFRQAP
ncbi:MAG: RHS repeat protein [Acidobacteria bacterium]|nr:RHS repeat protein [Acidobacteriota bacterium]